MAESNPLINKSELNYHSIDKYLDTSSSISDIEPHDNRPVLKRVISDYDGSINYLINSNNGLREWYSNYSSIDWIHDHVKEEYRWQQLSQSKDLKTRLLYIYDALQPYILLTLIGVILGIIAYLIVISSSFLSTLKDGYCITNPLYDYKRCCPNPNSLCYEFKAWAHLIHFDVYSDGSAFNFIVYFALAFVFALIASILVVWNPTKINRNSNTQIKYYAAGSGIPEVKVILSGFVMRGFLGIRTLIVKCFGLILAVSSGLSLGKEGPLVHIGCCVASILCRLFPKYNRNEKNVREILSASAAAGVAAAFGAPIGGVLFSLEEVSYYFPSKTLWASFWCAMVSALILKILNPFGTGQIVLFQVEFVKPWYTFEMLAFCLIGVFGGVYGALFSKLNIFWSNLRKKSWWSKYPVHEVIAVVSITTLANYFNPFTKMDSAELVAKLFSKCDGPEDREDGLCLSQLKDYSQILQLLALTIIQKFALTVITFGSKIPAGLFIPSMAIGACFGRIIGLAAQQYQQIYPTYQIFSICGEVGTNCFTPGVYALVGAASALAGATRMTVSLVVIMFELTGSLSYTLPIMLAVMISKWTGELLVSQGIYDLYIEFNEYPYLENRSISRKNIQLEDIVEKELPVIDVNEINSFKHIESKLNIMKQNGYEDGGFPIVDNKRLVGFIYCNDIVHALNDFSTVFSNNQRFNFNPHNVNVPDSSSNDILLPFIDKAPASISYLTSIEVLMEMFIKLGVKYVCVLDHYHQLKGVIHKKGLIQHLHNKE